MKRIGALLFALFGIVGGLPAAETLKPVSERFAGETQEAPSFQRHVLPLMGRLGCNGRSCHGSFQGQGGFRLSLFGYDFKADHDALLKGDRPRVNMTEADESLMLLKPTQLVPHKGGKRMEPDGWEHKLLTRWIKSGAIGVDEHDIGFERLEISPAQIVFTKAGETVQLKVTAVWRDGVQEDVTPICRFRTNDESVSEVDANGLVKSLGVGDTHIVAFYDNGVVPVQTLLAVSEQIGDKYPAVPTPTKIDELVVQKQKTLGMVPSDLCTDAEFLRRVSLDMTGTLPAPDEIEAFLADQTSDKRTKKIDELLERPAYATWWATRMSDILGNSPASFNNQERQIGEKISSIYFHWLEKRLKENVPYDQIVAGILVSQSRGTGQSYDDYVNEMATYFRKDNPADMTAKPSIPFFWMRKTFTQPPERSMATAYAFLGVRLQCAQCHKHPFDQWTQDDFNQFTNFFGRIVYNQPESKEDRLRFVALNEPIKKDKNAAVKMIDEGKSYPFREVYLSANDPANKKPKADKNNKQPKVTRSVTARALGDDPVDLPKETDPRQVLMNWMREKDNPYFARAFVNRLWSAYFGVGIIEPADDLNLANPPSNAPLLDHLAKSFIDSNFDIKRVHREIANSRTYQLSWKTNDTNKLDTRNFSHSMPRRLPAEVAYDAVKLSVAAPEELAKWKLDPHDRAISTTTGYQRNGGAGKLQYGLVVFGRPVRQTNCDCERSNEPSLLQTIYLRNDNEIYQTLQTSGWLKEVDKKLGVVTPEENRKRANEQRQKDSGKNRFNQITKRIAQTKKQLERLKAEDKPDNAKKISELELIITDSEGKLAQLKQQNPKIEEEQPATPAVPAPVVVATAVEKPAVEKPAEEKKLSDADWDAVIREAYLRTVSRPPTADEIQRSKKYITESEQASTGMRDLVWALLNTKEFIVNH
jgi:hypothetical protein